MYTPTILEIIMSPDPESAKGSVHYRGSVLWNKIPLEIRYLPSLNVFETSFHEKDYLNTL